MFKLNNNSIVFSLGIMAILAFGVITAPAKIYAATCSESGCNYTYNSYSRPIAIKEDNPKPIINSIDPNYSNIGVGTKTITITGENFVPDSVGKVNGANRPTTFIDEYHLLMQVTGNDLNAYQSNGGFFITVFNPAPAGGYSGTIFFTITNDANGTGSNFSNTPTPQTGNGNNTNGNSNGNYSNLASNAVFGSNSVYPSGLIQWILFAIIILLIVILVRKIYGGDKKYLSTPLKHD